MSREEYKDAIEVSVIFHEGQRMFAVPKQPAQQEPVAWLVYAKGSRRYFTLTFDVDKVPEIYKGGAAVPLYTSPPARKPLTKSQVLDLWEQTYVQRGTTGIEFARAIEAAHGIGEKK